ncbi:MAG: glycosyltransferase family 4 protein [Pseudomonadota bacterium]
MSDRNPVDHSPNTAFDLPLPDLNGKTILQVIPTLEAGGAERTTIDIAEGVVKAGGQALVASAGGRLESALKSVGGKHVTLPLDAKARLDRHLTNRFALKALCKREQVSLVHARSRAPAFAALAAARSSSLPFITTYHGIYSERTALKRWYNSVMAAGDAVIANSHYTKSIVLSRYGLPPDKVPVVHRGTDLQLFDPARIAEEDSATLRAQWKIPEHRPVVLLLARITEIKGHIHAVEALGLLKKRGMDIPCLVFAGRPQSESYVERIKHMIAETGLGHDVSFVGHVDNVPLALSVADIVIQPSTKPETFGRAAAEAQAFCVPAISYDHGGATETIAAPPYVSEDARTGYRVKLGDRNGLADAVEALLTMGKDERLAMGRRGRNHIANHFSLQRMVADTLNIYSSFL